MQKCYFCENDVCQNYLGHDIACCYYCLTQLRSELFVIYKELRMGHKKFNPLSTKKPYGATIGADGLIPSTPSVT